MNDRNDFDSLFPAVPFSRRGFLVSSVASGFALAVQPVMAQNVIMTDTKGLDTGEAFIPVQGARGRRVRHPKARRHAGGRCCHGSR
jgi:hypothetical protein